MADLKTSDETTRSPIDGTEFVRLATSGANWKAALSSIASYVASTLTIPSASNPSASVGTSAVNGTAATFMRSDAAPALSQSIAPTWTGIHTFNAARVQLPVVAQFGGTTSSFPELLRSGSGLTVALADGSDNTGLTVATVVATGGGGASASLGREATGGGLRLGSLLQVKWSSTTAHNGTSDLFQTRSAAATLQLGDFNAASPVDQTLQAQGSRSGTDSNTGGASLTIRPGAGTGTGTLSSLILQSPVAVASGTGSQTQTTGLTIKGGQAVHSSYTVATLPTGITGGTAYVTDGDAALGWGATAVNSGAGATKYLVWFNGTNWTVVGK